MNSWISMLQDAAEMFFFGRRAIFAVYCHQCRCEPDKAKGPGP